MPTLTLVLTGDKVGRMTDQLPCQVDPDRWFSEGPKTIADSKIKCGGCPVKEECFNLAVSSGEKHGIWGGVNFEDPNERPNIDPDYRLCRNKKHHLPEGETHCKECRNDTQRRFEMNRVRTYNKPYVRQKIGDTCNQGHEIVGDNVKIREHDKAVMCRKCNSRRNSVPAKAFNRVGDFS